MSLMKKLMLILIYAGLLNSTVLFADEEAEPELLSAGELLSSCEEGSLPGEPNVPCMQYVVGLVLTVMQLHEKEQSQPFFCIDPQNNPKEEVTDKVLQHLRNQSSRSNEPAQTLALEALTKNYPCGGSGSQI